VIIRGIDTEIGTEEASYQILKMFEARFGKGNVMSCNCYRLSKQPKKLYRKLKFYKKKYDET